MKKIIDKPQFTTVQEKGGKLYWRFRRGRIEGKLDGQPGEPIFVAEYLRLLDLSNAKKAERPAAAPLAIAATDTFSWLCDQYLKSAEFSIRKPLSQKVYMNAIALLKAELGHHPYKLISAVMVKTVRDRIAVEEKLLSKAHSVKKVTSLLFSWAQENSLVEPGHNPAKVFKRLDVKGKQIVCWSEEEIELFMAHCPAWLRLPVMLGLYTGQRVCDVALMDWTQIHGSIIRIKQEKTEQRLDIFCHRTLLAELAKVDVRKGRICRAQNGKPISSNTLSKAVSYQIMKTPGMPKNRSFHGLRYAAAARLEEAGCTLFEITAVTGHRAAALGLQYALQRKATAAAAKKREDFEDAVAS